MVLSNISVPLLGMVDTGVVGHLESDIYLGAVAVGATIFGFLYWTFNFLRMGTTGIAAQLCGADDNAGLRTALGQAMVVAVVVSALLLALQAPLGNLSIYLIGPNPDVAGHAREYFSIRIWSAPATLVNYALIGWFLGLQNARVPLVLVLVINMTNIVLDLVFVLGLGMKVDGVALASVIAEYCGVAVGLMFAWSELRRRVAAWSVDRLTRFGEYTRFFEVNAALFIRTLALVFAFTFFTSQGARQSDLILAANAVLMTLHHLLSFGLDGLAHAAEALVGKAYGAKDSIALRRAVSLTLRWSLIIAAGYSVMFLMAGAALVSLLTDLENVRSTAFEYLPWLIVSPMISVWSYLYDGVFIGVTKSRAMRDIMLGSTALIFLPAWYFLQPLGNHGLWLAFILFMVSRGVGMHYYYRRRIAAEL
ncbi:MAG: MATE family efflux transporter [Gammaproteobacteria bacterium]|nr:MATE family efflux transporter [Gammaproteobacteria bacterium]